MWKVVYIAQNTTIADKIKAVLESNGFLTQTKLVGNRHGSGIYEISVPFSEVEDAYEVICENKI